MISENIFREYDVRGVVGRELTAEVAFLLGRAFSVMLKKRNPSTKLKVSIGMDVRLSSGMLSEALIRGIAAEGIDVVRLGACPTPLQYFSIARLKLDGGIMVTGSHNPPDYNGFKISIGRETIHGRDIQEIKALMLAAEWSQHAAAGSIEDYDVISDYRSYMLSEFGYLADAKYRRLKVVVDAGNGTGGLVGTAIISALGCDVIPLYCEPDGNFPNHHPDPTVVENIQDMIAEVKKSGADFGVGYDGDSDRIGIVDRSGKIVWGDQLLILLGRELLAEEPGAMVIADVKCSQLLFDDIASKGGRPVMWKTGHSLVKQKMKDEKAPLAGEFSGHIFIGGRYFGFDDALYTTFRIIEIIKRRGLGIDELLADLPELHFTPELRLDCPDEIKQEVVDILVKRFIALKGDSSAVCRVRAVDTTDGARVVFDNGWGLVRSSNTQPVIVMRVEANSKADLDLYLGLLNAEFAKAMEAAA